MRIRAAFEVGLDAKIRLDALAILDAVDHYGEVQVVGIPARKVDEISSNDHAVAA
jgi:hypothetical protein